MRRTYLLLFILVATFLSGCVKEDLSLCAPADLKVYFSYDLTYTDADFNPADIEKINIFVFDLHTNILVGMAEDNRPKISPKYHITVKSIPKGDYRIVTWGGLKGEYETTPNYFKLHETNFEDAELFLKHGATVTNTIKPLFNAYSDQIEVVNYVEQTITLPLIQNTNNIHLTTEGLDENSDKYELRIYDNNGRYKFDNSFASDSDFTYISECQKDDSQQPFASLRVLRLASGRDARIELYNITQDRPMYTANLTTLLDARGFNYDLTSEYNIHLEFINDLNVTVSIEGWIVSEGGIII